MEIVKNKSSDLQGITITGEILILIMCCNWILMQLDIRTICDKATILMLVYNTPLIFWEDAVKQSIYVGIDLQDLIKNIMV